MGTAIHLQWQGQGPVHASSSDDPVSADQLTILIGGVNDAYRQSLAFHNIWDRLKQRVARRRFSGELLYFFWLAGTGRWGALGLLRYSDFVVRADAAGAALAQYLMELHEQNPRQQVSLAAHSLGCRVALSAARDLQATHPIRHLLLMGAAVPEFECGPEGLYPGRNHDVTSTINLWSDKDASFGFWWNRGEAAALRKMRRSQPQGGKTSIGLSGGPKDRWRREKKSCGLSHKQYWRENLSLQHVAWLLGQPIERPSPSRGLHEATTETRSQPTREQPARTISGG